MQPATRPYFKVQPLSNLYICVGNVHNLEHKNTPGSMKINVDSNQKVNKLLWITLLYHTQDRPERENKYSLLMQLNLVPLFIFFDFES